MKILFKCTWKRGRDPKEAKSKMSEYCLSLAEFAIANRHQIVLTPNNPFNDLLAREIAEKLKGLEHTIDERVLWLLPDSTKNLPEFGTRLMLPATRWKVEGRTLAIQTVDAVIAIGGGKGTSDCIEKAFLARKPVFVPSAVRGTSVETWKKHKGNDYYYLTPGDADFNDNLFRNPDDFFGEVFHILNTISESKYPRRIFIIHGHKPRVKDKLVEALKKLKFEPVVLKDQPDHALTIIEKLERDTPTAGFAFVLYTADDLGRVRGGAEQSRARQNVIFEHGMLMGLLGRERTCAFVEEGIETPSDLDGIIHEKFKKLDEIPHKSKSVLKHAGYPVED